MDADTRIHTCAHTALSYLDVTKPTTNVYDTHTWHLSETQHATAYYTSSAIVTCKTITNMPERGRTHAHMRTYSIDARRHSHTHMRTYSIVASRCDQHLSETGHAMADYTICTLVAFTARNHARRSHMTLHTKEERIGCVHRIPWTAPEYINMCRS